MRHKLNTIQWCPKCGDFLILGVIRQTLKDLNIAPENTVIISGIGCSGKMSQYINGYGAETLHGRALPFATGVALANPKLTVIVVGGDGDGYGIGVGHFIHACRRNVNMVYIVCDNENYGLTTGQASPTTPEGVKTSSTPMGNAVHPLNPLELAKAAGCKFSREVYDKKIPEFKQVLKEAIAFDGFAHISVLQDCPSYKRRESPRVMACC